MTTTELRLYAVALLAAVYAISWRAIGGHALAPPQTSTAAAPAPVRPQPRTVWLDNVPPAARPPIALPAGWQLASQAPAIETQPILRAPDRTVRRVRTRSS